MTTYYDVLGVRSDADTEELRRAYLRIARRSHPDVLAVDDPRARRLGEDRMRDANEAWRVLGDPVRRQAYDQQLAGAARADDGAGFRPFDTGEDPDPRDAPDVPYRHDPAAGSPRRRAVTLAPVASLAGAVAALSLAAVVRAPALVGVAVVLAVVAGVGFLVLPLLALSRATRDEG